MPLPRLVLQPLLENAVLHGVSRLPQGGTIDIGITADDGLLRIAVRNPAPPPRRTTPAAVRAMRSAASAIGWRIAFGPRARMTAAVARGLLSLRTRHPIGCRSARRSRQP